MTPVLGEGDVKVEQVVAVEDDALQVYLGPAYAQAVKNENWDREIMR